MSSAAADPQQASASAADTLALPTLKRAIGKLLARQKADGGWEGEMVWNSMILSQYIIVMHIVGRRISDGDRAQMVQHYRATRTGEGGWGMHGESRPYVFFTTLSYVALRLLGVPAADPLCAEARAWLHQQPGGVLHIPTWGKLWLALLGLYGYDGVNPFPPEIFLLPRWVPFSPSNFYCHTRYIYLGIAYLYGRRFVADLGPLRDELRRELYREPYEQIDFAAYRHRIAESDLYVAPTAALRAAYDFLYAYEKRPVAWLRENALGHCFDRILYEQRASRYEGLSPVNGLLNCLALYSHSPHHPDLAASLDGLEAWKWEDAEAGLRYCGAHSNTWDTAFAMQAIAAAPAAISEQPQVVAAIASAHRHLLSLQQLAELPDREPEGRDGIVGGWCFSNGQHRWPVSDCTAEALVALLQVEARYGEAIGTPVSLARVESAVRFLLARQNDDGGFGTYERRRGPTLLEQINPSEMYGSCMTERSYLECTASALRGLGAVRDHHARHFSIGLRQAVDLAVERAVERLSAAQRADGSWPGFWGINFTYAIFHVVKALRRCGVAAADPRLERAALWLLSKQRPDGGWGEHYSSCLSEQYVEHSHSQVVMTSWALLALLELGPTPDRQPAIERAIDFLRRQQLPDGDFPQQAQNGVFFGTAMLDYRLYKTYFPTWALARYLSTTTTA